ncbi:MAG TPA: site-specific DNA-methyltransferase [Vicinamibacterales bacterium]|nr:site-specific DNA-methyltransferase [Vicinamibacterales bacterium]
MLPRLGERSVDVIVTSPPYNLGVEYRTYDDQLPREEYLQWTNRWAAAAKAVLAPHGSLFLNVGHKPTDPWVAMDVAQTVRRHLHLQNLIHWVKSIAIDERGIAAGHYKPINSDRFLNDCHEFIFHFTPAGHTRLDRRAVGVPYQDKSNVSRWRAAASDVRCRGNTWFIPYETIQSRDRERPHPATFPARVPEMCVRLHGLDRSRLVLDPFLGLGSTAVACARLGTSFVGIDMDAHYLSEAVERTQAALRDAGEPFSVENRSRAT